MEGKGTRFLLRIRPALLPTGSAGCGWRFQESHILSPPAADAQQKAAKKTCWRCMLARRLLLFPPVDWMNVAKRKYAPEIRDRSHTARNQASLILADVFYRYAADTAFGCLRQPFQALHALSPPQTSIAVCYRRNQPTKAQSFKGRAAQQTEHREAMTKQDGKRQIKLA